MEHLTSRVSHIIGFGAAGALLTWTYSDELLGDLQTRNIKARNTVSRGVSSSIVCDILGASCTLIGLTCIDMMHCTQCQNISAHYVLATVSTIIGSRCLYRFTHQHKFSIKDAFGLCSVLISGVSIAIIYLESHHHKPTQHESAMATASTILGVYWIGDFITRLNYYIHK